MLRLSAAIVGTGSHPEKYQQRCPIHHPHFIVFSFNHIIWEGNDTSWIFLSSLGHASCSSSSPSWSQSSSWSPYSSSSPSDNASSLPISIWQLCGLSEPGGGELTMRARGRKRTWCSSHWQQRQEVEQWILADDDGNSGRELGSDDTMV
jgi:hypothetical protein